jgi:probable F420-dependent oxidoreductase
MRVGLALPHYDFSYPDGRAVSFDRVAHVAREAERLGFDSVWVSDHFFASLERYGGESERYGSLEPLSTLAALAPVTGNVRLGTLVLSAGFRHPAILAKAATAIDLLSGGRLDLGLGAGWFAPEFEAFGYPFGSTRDRFRVLEETLEVLTRLFGPGPASYEGERFALREAYNHPPPAQRPGPPIWLGGKGGPKLLSLAARLADGWNTAWRWTPDAYGHRVSAARHACEEAGRDPATLRLSLGLFTVLGEDEADLDRRFELMRERLPAGVVDKIPRRVLEQECLVGTPERALGRLARFAELGVEELIVSPAPLWFSLPDPSMLDLLAEAVIPGAHAL